MSNDSCGCGWMLPLSIIPFPVGVEPEYGKWISEVYVVLRCPVCEHGHAFINTLEASGKKELQRQVATVNKKRN